MRHAVTTLLMRAVRALAGLYWWVVQPVAISVKVWVERDGHLLLVRHTYGPEPERWHLPGGHVKRRESTIEAAIREVWEECGVRIRPTGLIGVYYAAREYKHDHLFLFRAVAVAQEPAWRNPEVAQAAFFPLDALPPLSGGTARRVPDAARSEVVFGPW
ncbi:MAG: NUDIX domain-containing protein [Armatimonadota bacterium]|nr:NUDIX domain-containing protein [Armatimonadota bacterium]MDR5697651.1 NUDIX domain-containing protein [Armatimonadota bacterium]